MKCAISLRFGMSSVLFVRVLVYKLCYSSEFWSVKCHFPLCLGAVKCVIPASFGL